MSYNENYPLVIVNTQYLTGTDKAKWEEWNQSVIQLQRQQQTSTINPDPYDHGATSNGQYIYHSYFGSGTVIRSVIG